MTPPSSYIAAVERFRTHAGITACTGQQKRTSDLHSFNSIDEAFAAVDDVLDCDAQPVGDPIVPMGDGAKLVTAQRLCSQHVQVDFYPDPESVGDELQDAGRFPARRYQRCARQELDGCGLQRFGLREPVNEEHRAPDHETEERILRCWSVAFTPQPPV